ncbi:MAG: exosortase E/protease, VPEID-CTERM system [Myxococcaceae bacterium]
MKQRGVLAAAALALEYLLFSVLFDAVELVPDLDGLGDLAPMPLIVGVAFFILRSSASDGAPTSPERIEAPTRASNAILAGSHLLAYGAFLVASFRLRALVAASGATPLGIALAWGGLGALPVGLLAAFAFSRDRIVAFVRHAAGPIALGSIVGVAAWLAGRSTADGLWEPLSRWTLQPVAALVGLFSGDLVFDLEQLQVGTSRFYVTVAPICSGYEGMGLVAVLLGAYLWSFRRTLRFPHALLLPLLAVAAAFTTNVLRIASLIYVGTFGSAEVAMGGFHSKAGWLLFCGVALGITWIARRVPIFQRAPDAGEARENPTAAYLLPLLALVAGALVTGLASDGGLDRFELVRLGAAGLAFWICRDVWRRAEPMSWSWIGPGAGVLVFVLWMALDRSPADASAAIQQQLDLWPQGLLAVWVATRLLGSVVVVPIVEELAFRGFLLRRVVSADFTSVSYRHVSAVAVVVSSIAFGALHDRWFAGAIAGVAYAGAAWARGRLSDAVIAHVVTNGLIAMVVLTTGRWSLWT